MTRLRRNLPLLVVGLLTTLAFAFRRVPLVASVTNFAVLLLIVLVFAVAPALLLGDAARVLALKLAAVVFLSLLPGCIYLQFVAVKGRTLWEEYVVHLFRLHVDDFGQLPEPPSDGPLRSIWEAHGGRTGHETIYRKKFEGLYGKPEDGATPGERRSFQGENLFPVIVATLLIAISWTMALQPESLLGWAGPEATVLEWFPAEGLLYGFAGAYFYVLQMLVRRYFQDDLKTSAYVSATVRFVVVGLLVVALNAGWSNVWGGPLCFVLGVFPQVGFQALRTALAKAGGAVVPSLETKHPLSDLRGMNIWYESRLLEEGIEDLQNLATADIVEVILRTRVPVDRLVDWIDQAHLYLRVSNSDAGGDGKRPSRDKLARLGILTATDLETAVASGEEYDYVLNESDDTPSVTRTIVKVLADEPNLHHVRMWKRFGTLLEWQGQKLSLGDRSAEPDPGGAPIHAVRGSAPPAQ